MLITRSFHEPSPSNLISLSEAPHHDSQGYMITQLGPKVKNKAALTALVENIWV